MYTLDLVPEAIGEYALAHTTAPSPLLQELLATTQTELGERARMLSGPIEGQLLQLLARALNARRVLEIGMFTGFSTLMLAEGIAADGELITCEIDPRAIALAKRFFARSPFGRKITIQEGPALATLQTLRGPFDLVFIDADKPNYINYYEAVLPLTRTGGLIVADNVLRGGGVLSPRTENERAMAAFNEHVRHDPRVRTVTLTVRDGIMLISPR
ncbi:MAG TPA: class I SAM-dependent methyltransferase [Chloroflexota bacterium]|nr:class I SAM-dependent methyltransferase [Chloroflexota bacterium]